MTQDAQKHPLLTVCIVHYRRLEQLQKTIDALFQNTRTAFLLRVYNNGYEDDGIREYLDGINQRSDTTVIFDTKNIGCSPARHEIVKNIETPFILMLDDDMYVNKDWDVPVFKKFAENPTIGAIGFSIYKIDGSFWWTGGRNIILSKKEIKIERPHIDPEKSDLDFIELDDVAAGAMIYRKELEDIIVWDKNYFIGFEDLEKGLHLKQSKYSCLVSIQSKFIHDKISEKQEYAAYNNARRNYHAYRRSYLHFLKENRYRLDLKRHLFYKYVCLLPNNILQKLVYTWLSIKKKG
ncbi:MAG: glycosyltransferase family 2 protein [Candidatus Nomurabacteria bacterium]|nr:MAG: glycosyltransferase family 2 protein [Candidatus Nomurabacteria bacterium]